MSSISIIILCLLLSAFFSGMEIAFLSANRLRIELDKMHGFISAKIISFFIQHPGKYLATILIGNNLVLVIYGIIIAKLLDPIISQYLYNEFLILVLQTLISTVIILIAAEFLPKIVFKALPNFFLKYFSVPVYFFYILFYPISEFIIRVTHKIMQRIGNEFIREDKYIFGKVDLEHFITESGSDSKDLDAPSEFKIFRRALDFSSVKLRDCMVPRTELAAVDISSTFAEIKQKFIETGYSKILVYSQNIDNIIGYLNIKDLFKQPHDWHSKIIKVSFVPETMLANKMLRELLREHKSLAVVVDEFGGTAGIVTIEDLIEEIFGEIEDEHDTPDQAEKVLSENSFVFSGKLTIDYLNEKYNLELPVSEEYDTLAGYIMYNIGRIPSLNETFTIDPYFFKVLKSNKNRIDIVYLKKLNEE